MAQIRKSFGCHIFRISWTCRLLVPVLAALMLSSVVPARAQQPPDPALLEELAERLLVPTFSPPGQPPPRVELLPGALPPNLPVSVPMPPGSRLIGSAVRTSIGPPGTQTDIVLDVPGQAATVFGVLRDALPGLGWTASALGPDQALHGFQPVTQTLLSNFCRSERGPWLQLTVMPRELGPSDVRFTIYSDPGPCSTPPGRPGAGPSGPPGQRLVPLIATPEGVTLTRSDTLVGDGTWASFAIAASMRGVAEIETDIAHQLAAAGWTRTGGVAGAPLSWSAWSVPGEGNWEGVLTVFEGPGLGQRWLQIQVASPRVPLPAQPDGAPGP